MDALTAVSLTLGIISIVLAGLAIGLSIWINRSTEKALGEIKGTAAVIDERMRGTHDKLVDAVTEIVKPQKATMEEQLLQQFMSGIFSNPSGLEQLKDLAEWSQQMEKDKPKTEEDPDGN